MPEVLPELGALAAAAFLLLIAAALWVAQGLLKNSLGRLPVVGGWITSNLDAALNDARNAVLSGASASWGAAVQMFKWAEAFIRTLSNAQFSALSHIYTFASRLYDVTLPNLESRVATDASNWVSSAETYALGLANSATSYALGLVTRALTTTAGWITTAENDAVALFDRAAADITSGVIAAETDAANLVTNASTTLSADIHSAEVFAQDATNALASSTQGAVNVLAAELAAGVATAEHLASVNLGAAVGGIYTDLDTWGRQAIAEAWPDVTGDIGALRQTLGADFPWLNDLLGALGGVGAAGLLRTLVQSQAAAQAVTRLATDCVVPQCRNLGGLSHDLGDLLSTASTAAMLAWLIFAVTDPAGWAAETESVAGPLGSELAGAAARLFQGA
jgi:hypothetical protein